jgi:Protein of unknown function (DUF3592)
MKPVAPKAVSLFLTAIALIFGGLGVAFSIWAAQEYTTWPTVDAVVDSINAKSVADNKYGSISVKLHYMKGAEERSTWALRSEFRSQGEKFMREYGVGTHHRVWIDPTNPQQARIGLGWNLATIFAPLCFFSICFVLLVAGRYFWRYR